MPHKNLDELRAYKRRYAKTPIGKAIRKRYKQSPVGIAAGKRYRLKLKLEAFRAYGGVCACCGEERFEFLAIDHINGGGRKHRAQLGVNGGVNFYRWLRINAFPAGYRVLCHNCNMSLGIFGYCPHLTKK